jgi:ABC-type glycerol-3-phosphate transport system substrate-binding protein
MEEGQMHTSRLFPKVRRWATLCVVGLIGALIGGCALVAPPPEPATISLPFPERDAEHFEALLLTFNEHYPQITVELHPNPYEGPLDPETEIRDVLAVSQYMAVVLAEQNEILNLDSLIEQDRAFELSASYPGTIDGLSFDGKTWAIPYGVDLGRLLCLGMARGCTSATRRTLPGGTGECSLTTWQTPPARRSTIR